MARALIGDLPGREADLIRAVCALELGDARAPEHHARAVAQAAASDGDANDRDFGFRIDASCVELRIALHAFDCARAERIVATLQLLRRTHRGDEHLDRMAIEADARLAETLVDLGRPDDARRSIERAETALRRRTTERDAVSARLLLLHARMAMQIHGSFAAARTYARSAFDVACAVNDPRVAAKAALVLAGVPFIAREYRHALEETDLVLAVASGTDVTVRATRCIRAQSYSHLGDDERAEAEFTLAEAGLGEESWELGAVRLTRMDGYLRRGEFGIGAATLDASARSLSKLGCHPLLGVQLAYSGAVAHGLGDRRRARAFVSDALDMLASHRDAQYLAVAFSVAHSVTGERRFRRACERLLPLRPTGAAGARRAVPARTGRATHLTPRERDVARLVAEGCANREVAERLAVSVRTVGHHVESIFNKVGVRSRWQLREALAKAQIDCADG